MMHYTMILHVRHQVLMLRLLAGLGRDAGPRERAQAAAALRAIVHELHSPEGAAAAAAAAAGGGGGGGGCSEEEEEEDPAARGYSYLPDSDEGEEDADDEGYGEGDADYRKNFEKYLATQHGIQPSNQVGEEELDFPMEDDALLRRETIHRQMLVASGRSALDEALEPRYVYPPRGPPQEQLPPLPTLPTPEPLQLVALGVEGAAERLVRSWAKP